MTVDATNVFGPWVDASEVEEAVIANLDLWFDTYLAEVERRYGYETGELKKPWTWEISDEFTQEQGNRPPAGIVISPGTLDQPAADGEGKYSAWFDVRVAIVIAAGTRKDSNRLAKLYGLAAVQIMLNKKPAGGLIANTEWYGNGNASIPQSFLKAAWGVECSFGVLVREVATRYGGPATPNLAPGPIPHFETAEVISDRRRPL